MKMNKIFQIKVFTALILVLGLLSGCQQDFDNAVPEAAEVNYFSVSDFLAAQGAAGNSGATFPVYMDEDNAVRPDQSIIYYPLFQYSKEGVTEEFPKANKPVSMTEVSVFYQRIPASGHTFFFHCDTLRETVVTKQLNPAYNSRTLLYLTDDSVQNGSANWEIVNVPETDKSIDDNKVTVRFLNFSPDAGELTLKFKNRDGSYAAGAQTKVNFPNYTDYLEVDTTGLTNRNQLLFDIADTSGTVALSGYVSALPGAVYHIIARGFTRQQQGQIPYYRTVDGQIMKKSYTVSPRLRVSTRRIY